MAQTKSHLLKHICYFKIRFYLLKTGQCLLVRAGGRTEKDYTMGGELSLGVDDVDRQISLI